MKISKIVILLYVGYLTIITPSCNIGETPSGIIPGTFEHNNISRDFIYFSPESLKKEAPLVVVLHGYTGSAKTIMEYSKMNELAKEYNFAVLYPQGTVDSDSNAFFNVGYDFHKEVYTDDVGFIAELSRDIQRKYSLSKLNIFITGMSNGGEMSYLMACRHPELFSAAAPVAGMMLDGFFSEHKSKSPIPIFAIFGTKDEVTRYEGDPDNKDGWGAYPAISFTIEYWADKIKYTSTTIDTLPDLNKEDSSFVISTSYLNTENGNEVLYYEVVNGGHAWPGVWGNMDINTSKEIWSFFEKYIQ